MIDELTTIYKRDLDKLKNEIQSFQLEENLWKTTGSVINPAGNLSLHLIGNLNHYIGHHLGNTGYVRDRDSEFSTKNIPAEKLIADIDDVSEVVEQTLRNLSQIDLNAPYPEEVLGYETKTSFMLMHLSSHLSYHLGQINYIRRILD